MDGLNFLYVILEDLLTLKILGGPKLADFYFFTFLPDVTKKKQEKILRGGHGGGFVDRR